MLTLDMNLLLVLDSKTLIHQKKNTEIWFKLNIPSMVIENSFVGDYHTTQLRQLQTMKISGMGILKLTGGCHTIGNGILLV